MNIGIFYLFNIMNFYLGLKISILLFQINLNPSIFILILLCNHSLKTFSNYSKKDIRNYKRCHYVLVLYKDHKQKNILVEINYYYCLINLRYTHK